MQASTWWKSAAPRLAAACVALGLVVQASAQEPPASLASTLPATAAAAPIVDCFGDKLPAGAKIRLGTIRLRSGHSVESVAFSPDGKYVVSTGWEDSIRFWDVDTGALARRLVCDDHEEGTFGVAFSPDGQKLASVGERGFVRLWDLGTGKQISKVLGHVERSYGVRTYGVAFAPDGLTFATGGSDKTIRLWDAATGAQLLELAGKAEGGDARPVAYSHDGTLLASGDSKGTIQVWDLAEGQELQTISKAHQREVTSLVFTDDGKTLISSGIHFERTGERSVRSVSEIKAWKVADGKKQAGFEPAEKLLGNCSLAISRDGKILVSGHYEKVIVWNMDTRTAERTLRGDQEYHGGRSQSLAISPDNRLVAAGTYGAGTNKVYLWDLNTGEPILPFADCHTEAVLAMDASPDGSLIATGSADGTVRVWDSKTGQHVRLIDQGSGWVRYVQFFADGKRIALGRETHSRERPRFEGEVRICQVADGKVLHQFTVPDRVMCGALSADNERLAVGIGLGDDFPRDPDEGPAECKIVVWDTHSGQQTVEIAGAKRQYLQVSFDAAAETLWSINEGEAPRQWRVKDGHEIVNKTKGRAAEPQQRAWSLLVPGKSRVAIRGLDRDSGVSEGWLAVTAMSDDTAVWQNTFADSWPRQFAISSDGIVVAAFLYPLHGKKADRRIALFATADGRELMSIALSDGVVRSLAFSHDRSLLMAGMEAGDALVWNVSKANASANPLVQGSTESKEP
jgi:WD40 repeat protein